MSDEYILWLGAGLAAVILFRAGMVFERAQVKERQTQQQRFENDLAELARYAAQLAAGKLTLEEADASVKSSIDCGLSARKLWAGFSLEEKQELGVNATKMQADPEYVAKQNRLLQRLEALDPDLCARVRKSPTHSDSI